MFKEEVKEKVIRDGKVAVLCTSLGYGAGWSTWNSKKYRDILLFHPKLVEMVELGKANEITVEWVRDNLNIVDRGLYLGGAKCLSIIWVPEGKRIQVVEYDGMESIDYGTKFFTV